MAVFHYNQSLYRRLHLVQESIGYGRGDRFVQAELAPLYLGQCQERLFRFRHRPKWDFFAEGNATIFRQRNVNDVFPDGFRGESGGITLGLDHILSPNAVVGIGLGGNFSCLEADVMNVAVKNDVNSVIGSLYGIWGQNDWSFGGSAGLASNWFTSNRHNIDGNVIDVGYTGNIYFISAEASRKMRLVCGDFTPFYSLDLYHVDRNGLSEPSHNGTFGAEIDTARFETLLQMLGFRFSRRVAFGLLVLDPELKAAWLHDYGPETYQETDTYGGGTRPTDFKSPDKNRAYTGLTLAGTYAVRHTFYALYGTEQGHSYRSHRMALGYGLAF